MAGFAHSLAASSAGAQGGVAAPSPRQVAHKHVRIQGRMAQSMRQCVRATSCATCTRPCRPPPSPPAEEEEDEVDDHGGGAADGVGGDGGLLLLEGEARRRLQGVAAQGAAGLLAMNPVSGIPDTGLGFG